jgi:hypothetical protein
MPRRFPPPWRVTRRNTRRNTHCKERTTLCYRIIGQLIEDSREQFVWQASWVEVQPNRQAPFAVAFKMGAGLSMGLGRGTRGVGRTQLVWQFADCELQDIMQFVTVEVTGVESPTKGGTTFGVVAVCADATSCALE